MGLPSKVPFDEEFFSSLLGIVFPELRPIFEVRNKIIHELDINLDAERRNRNVRSRDQLMRHANVLLRIGEEMIKAVDGKIAAALE